MRERELPHREMSPSLPVRRRRRYSSQWRERRKEVRKERKKERKRKKERIGVVSGHSKWRRRHDIGTLRLIASWQAVPVGTREVVRFTERETRRRRWDRATDERANERARNAHLLLPQREHVQTIADPPAHPPCLLGRHWLWSSWNLWKTIVD